MLNFPCNKMQSVWDQLADKLPDNLYTLLVTCYLLDSSEPKDCIFNILIGYSSCLKDNGLQNEFVEKFIRLMLLKNLIQW